VLGRSPPKATVEGLPVRLASRPPLARLLAIDAAIGSGRCPNATSLGLELEVSPRTIYRDIDLLRDQLHAPVAFDPSKNGYRYKEPNYRLSTVRLTEGELVALAVAERVLEQYRGTPFEENLRKAFARICAWLPDSVTMDLAALGDTFSVQPAAPDLLDLQTFSVLTEAVQQHRQLTLRYWTASRNALGQRFVDPYHLALLNHDWYLIGFDHRRKRILLFKVARVRSARATGKTFAAPADFDINDYMGDSFRAMRGAEHHQVELRFSAGVAGRVAEKIWHRSQQTESLPGGELILRFQLSDLREVKGWILSWGAEVVVLEPEELRRQVQGETRQVLRKYRRNAKFLRRRGCRP